MPTWTRCVTSSLNLLTTRAPISLAKSARGTESLRCGSRQSTTSAPYEEPQLVSKTHVDLARESNHAIRQQGAQPLLRRCRSVTILSLSLLGSKVLTWTRRRRRNALSPFRHPFSQPFNADDRDVPCPREFGLVSCRVQCDAFAMNEVGAICIEGR